MKLGLNIGATLLAFAVLVLFAGQGSAQSDPLPSWNDGAAKQAIIAFVKETTAQGSPIVPPAESFAS